MTADGVAASTDGVDGRVDRTDASVEEDAPPAGREQRADASGTPLLSVRGLKKHFDQSEGLVDRLVGDAGTVKAVDGVDLDLHEGETLAVVGESGCGKSTLAKTILNLHHPTAGTVRFDGDDITGLTGREMRPYRRELQLVFQDPLASLNPRQTVREILTAPMEVHGIGEDDEQRVEYARTLLERVGLTPGILDRHPNQFSGGQQQRMAVARAIAVQPRVIVADEPVSSLDVSVQAQILGLLDGLQAQLGLSMLFIAHDMSVVRYVADRVAVMYLGEVVEVAPTEALFEDPHHPYTRSLLSAVPRIDPGRRPDRIVLEGTVPSPVDPPSGCRFHTRCPEVIPPADWPGSQQLFKAAFGFRNRVLGGELDPGAARSRLASEGRATDDEAVATYLAESTLDRPLAELPDDAAEAVETAAAAIVAGEFEHAESVVAGAFPSPCERESPAAVRVGVGHRAACHRAEE